MYERKYNKYKTKYLELKNNYKLKGGNMFDNSFIIVGGGPCGLFTAIYLNELVMCKIIDKPKIIIYENRMNNIGRLRQVVIIHKKYEVYKYIFDISGLIEIIIKHSECILYENTYGEPYECLNINLFERNNFMENENIQGITITLYNLERCLKLYIEQKYDNINFKNETFNLKNINSSRVVIFGCSGMTGEIRKKYTNFPTINELKTQNTCLSKYNFLFDEELCLYGHTYGGKEEDSYMLILRYPVHQTTNNIAFHYSKSDSDNKFNNIMISNYISHDNDEKFKTLSEQHILSEYDNKIFYRQIYYFINKSTFKNLSDCGFWNFCSLKDYFLNRTTCRNILQPNTDINEMKLLFEKDNIEISIDSSKEIIIFDDINSDDNIKFFIEPIIKTNKQTIILKQEEIFTVKKLNDIFTKGTKIILNKARIDRPYITKNTDSIEITIDKFILIGYQHDLYDNIYYQLVPEEFINIKLEENEILYLYLKENEEKILTSNIFHKLFNDIKNFNPSIEISQNDFLLNTEIFRIWTSVRFAGKINQIIDEKTTVLLGDESILVNPMTGRGVSNSINTSYNFLNILSKDNYENIDELISKFNEKCNIYLKYYYNTLCSIIEQGEDARVVQYIRHDFTIET